ncbi:NAD-dependent epimerase/dehydratase family protein [Sphingomonas sp. UYP23]
MTRTLFLAGSSGAIGRRLTPMLVGRGWRVFGTTRSAARSDLIREMGAEPVVVDVFDAASLAKAVQHAAPDVVIHQLTDLPAGLDPARMVAATASNARVREIGTRNLVDAAIAAGVRRLVAQSVAFAYAEGPRPHNEDAPLAVLADGRAGVSARGVASLEQQIMAAALDGVILRYGHLYGPGTGFNVRTGEAPLHVDDAALAAALAAEGGPPGIYNIAEDDAVVSMAKARVGLGWRPAARA